MSDEIRTGLLQDVRELDPRTLSASADADGNDGSMAPGGKNDRDTTDGSDADGTDAGDSDATDKGDSDGSDATDSDGTDGGDADGTDNA